MRKMYSIIIFTAIIALGTVIYGFTVAGSPFHAREVQFDQKRVTDLSDIYNSIQTYYSNNLKLPNVLSDLPTDNTFKIKDPETSQNYEYTVTGPRSFTLCADFKTKSEDNNYQGYTDPAYNHAVGHICFQKSLSTYNSETAYPTTTPVSQCSGSYCIGCTQNECGSGKQSGGGCNWEQKTNTCQPTINAAQNGEACYYNNQCKSNVCSSNVCINDLPAVSPTVIPSRL